MRALMLLTLASILGIAPGSTEGQEAAPSSSAPSTAAGVPGSAPMPDPNALLSDVEQNQRKLEALQKDYTYHVHTDEQELSKDGGVKKTETEEAESVTIDGVRVNRIVARNGKPLTPEEQQKESERVDKAVARAKERQAKVASRGGETDARGDEVMPLSRILELGTFSNPRRVEMGGRSTIVLDYAGNPQAKTHTTFEGIMRDVVGAVWIDEADRVMMRAQGHFLNDFKLGGGLVADVRKGTNFEYQATRVGDGVWLPAAIDGKGSVRVLLFANFNGHMHVTTSDYRRFRTSATIVGSHGVIGPDGTPVTEPQAAPEKPAAPQTGPDLPHD